jgi:lipopolysaccharide export system protein LptC
MSVELHLPDLPEVPISIGRPGPRPRRPWPLRLRDALSSYLPLLLMVALALATWWLLKNAPRPAPTAPTAGDAGIPDYTMRSFTVQRFAPDGRLRVQLEGRELRHFPVRDRIEIDELDLHAFAPDGRVTTASARRAVSNGRATEVTLEGGAVVDSVDSAGVAVQIRGEFLQALLDDRIVRTDQPAQLTQGPNRLSVGGLEYDGQRRLLRFSGPVQAVLQRPRR